MGVSITNSIASTPRILVPEVVGDTRTRMPQILHGTGRSFKQHELGLFHRFFGKHGKELFGPGTPLPTCRFRFISG